MQRHLTKLITAIFVLLITFTLTAQAQPEKYTFDPNHSYIMWHISHFGFSNPSGKWMIDGTLMLDQAKPQDSKVDVTVNVATMDTGLPELDKHLKGELFFNVAKFPTATFVSDKVTVTGKDTAKVHGMLTLLGASKPVTLNVKLNKMGISPINNQMTAGFSADTELNRSEFGMTSLSPGLGDKVKIHIEVEASKATG